MLSFILKKFAGRHHRKYIEKCRPIVTRINEFEQQYQPLTDEQLRAKTDEFRARIQKGETLDQILPRPLPRSRTPPAAWSAGRSSSATTS